MFMIFTYHFRSLGRFCNFILKVTNLATLRGYVHQNFPCYTIFSILLLFFFFKSLCLRVFFLVASIFILTSK